MKKPGADLKEALKSAGVKIGVVPIESENYGTMEDLKELFKLLPSAIEQLKWNRERRAFWFRHYSDLWDEVQKHDKAGG